MCPSMALGLLRVRVWQKSAKAVLCRSLANVLSYESRGGAKMEFCAMPCYIVEGVLVEVQWWLGGRRCLTTTGSLICN